MKEMTPRMEDIHPMIYSKQVRETVDFYTGVLGFELANHLEDWSWAALQHDQVQIMVSLPNVHLAFDRPIFTGSFYIRTREVATLWERIKDKARVCYELEEFEYGMREFAIYDNNGYLLQFGEPIDSFEGK